MAYLSVGIAFLALDKQDLDPDELSRMLSKIGLLIEHLGSPEGEDE